MWEETEATSPHFLLGKQGDLVSVLQPKGRTCGESQIYGERSSDLSMFNLRRGEGWDVGVGYPGCDARERALHWK